MSALSPQSVALGYDCVCRVAFTTLLLVTTVCVQGNIHNPARLNVYKQSMGEQRHTSCANHVTTAEDTTNNYKDAVKMRNDNLQKQRGNSNLLSYDE